jgi:hypothetical protein
MNVQSVIGDLKFQLVHASTSFEILFYKGSLSPSPLGVYLVGTSITV